MRQYDVATRASLPLTEAQRTELTEISQSRSLPAGYVFRAKLILMLADGCSFNTIKKRLQTTAPTIIRWKARFQAQGIDGLDTFHPGQKPTVLAGTASQDSGRDTQEAHRWLHALELP